MVMAWRTVPPPVRIFVPLRSPSYIYGYKIRLQKFDQNKNVAINLIYNPLKRKFAKGQYKGPKRPLL